MANSDKNIIIRPRTGDSTNNPVLEFIGASSGLGPQTITFEAKSDNQGTVEVKGVSGTILTISDNATYPLLVAKDTRFSGLVSFDGELALDGNVTIGNSTADTLTINSTIQGATPLRFEGATSNANEINIAITDPTADRTITIPDNSGTVAVAGASTSTQSELDVSVGVDGVISGSAEGLGTTDTPTFAGLIINGSTLTFEGSSADIYETFLIVTNPTLDRNITLPDATGTVAVSVTDTTTTTQSLLNLDFTLSSTGNISATGSAHNLGTTATPTFAGLVINGSTITFEGSIADTFETQLTVVNPTADQTITLPNASGTVAVSVTDTTTSSQGALNLNFTLSTAGNISAIGSAENLTTSGTPTFSTVTTTGALTVGTDLVPDTDNTGNVGTTGLTWNNGVFTNLTVDTTLSVRGAIDLADSDILRFGTSDDWEFFHNGTGNFIDLNVGDMTVRDGTTTRFTFEKTTGNFVSTGLHYVNTSQRVFADNYHPNADTLTTARTISLGGVLSGSASFNGSSNIIITAAHTSDPVITLTGAVTGSGTMTNLGNVSITTTATSDPTLTLAGDATGTATFTSLGNATLTVAVVDDSHSHSFNNLLNKTSGTGDYTTTGTFTGATFNATSTTNGGFQGIDADSATAPSFTWTADLNTGMYRVGTDSIGFTAGGVNRLTVSTTAITAALPISASDITVSSTLDVRGAIDLADNDILRFGTSDDWEFFHNGTGNFIDLNVGDMTVRDGTTTRFTFERTTGNFTATGDVTAFSDARLKTNVATIPKALDMINKMRGVIYEKDGRKGVGVIAQEIEEILPEVVNNAGEYKSVAYGNIVGVLIEAIKELTAEVEELKKSKN